MRASSNLLLGAHVSIAGGLEHAPARGRAIGASAIQIFTKTPSQWREPVITEKAAAAFRTELSHTNIRAVLSHDSYLINLASPDAPLRKRSVMCFTGELLRCRQLGIPYVVTHPGNFMDDRAAGLRRNAAAYAECLERVSGPMILIETTAGTGTALGHRFDELAALRKLVPRDLRPRIAFCADTCHLYSAGYDLVNDWEQVWRDWDRVIGLEHLRCFHLNDSKHERGSRRDRHEHIGRGAVGLEGFRLILNDPRLRELPMVLETPKGPDLAEDRVNLAALRALVRGTRR